MMDNDSYETGHRQSNQHFDVCDVDKSKSLITKLAKKRLDLFE
jgi:hypothetical protein